MKRLINILLFLPLICFSQRNIVGLTTVNTSGYPTNNGVTNITVGASGADYTSLINAYAAANAGNVIQIIDDTLTLASALVISKTVDGSGKAIKIKGKSTKTVLKLPDVATPISGTTPTGLSVEFENIEFLEDAHGSVNYMCYFANVTGFIHFINCDFWTTELQLMVGTARVVYDGCTFTRGSQQRCIQANTVTAMKDTAIILINNCTVTPMCFGSFLSISRTNPQQFALVEITNSYIIPDNRIINIQLDYDLVDSVVIKGCYASAEAPIYFGKEMSGSTISGINAYAVETTYNPGDLVTNIGNLWENISSCTGVAPNKQNTTNWRSAQIITGTIENNVLKPPAFIGSGHGLFLGFGCYGFSIKNNIITNFNYNYVIKGYNNTIQYNCSGNGAEGLAIFANDQASVYNNTIRNETLNALIAAPQCTPCEGLINTTFRDNIVYSDDKYLNDYYSRWYTTPPSDNVFTQNIYSGLLTGTSSYKGVSYIMGNNSNFTNFKTAIGDGQARFIDITFQNNSIDTIYNYYMPTNIRYLRDQNNGSIGAVDYIYYEGMKGIQGTTGIKGIK